MPQTRAQTLRSSVKNQRPVGREPGELYLNLPDRQIGFLDSNRLHKDLVAVRFFSDATDYAAGDFVLYGGQLWKAVAAVPAGPFNAALWGGAPLGFVSISDVPPLNPVHGQLWWESDTSNLYVRYQDPDSAAWIQVVGPEMTAASSQAAIDRAEAAAEAAEEAAEDAQDAANAAAGAVSDVVSAGNVPIFSTVQALLAYSVNPDLTAIRVNGYEAVGDGGAAFYVKRGSAPSHAGKFQSGDGAWWELDEDYVKPEMFGAEGNGVADDTAALVAASSAAVGIKAELLFTGKYLATANTTITPLVNFSEHGGLKAASGITVTLAGGYKAPSEAYVFDISAGGYIWPTKDSIVTQYHYGAVDHPSYSAPIHDDTAALQATIDASLYFMQSDRVRFIAGVHTTTKPLMVNYGGGSYRQISIEGPGPAYSFESQFVGFRINSDHWGNCFEINAARQCTITGIGFSGPWLEQILRYIYHFDGTHYNPFADPYLIETWMPKQSTAPQNVCFPNAGGDAPKGILGRYRLPAAVAIDPRAGPKPVVQLKTAVRFVALTGDLATQFENGDSHDGLTLATNDRFLYARPMDGFGDTGAVENGIYVVQASGAAVRATDADAPAELENALVPVTVGTYGGTQWICNTIVPQVGLTKIIFWQSDGKIARDDYAYPPYSGVSEQYNKNFSSDVTVRDCYMAGFGACMTIQACDADGNGDFMQMVDCNTSFNVYTMTWGNTQARDCSARDCAFSFSRVHFSTGIVGRQLGKPMLNVDACHVGNCLDIVDMPNGDWGGGVLLNNCYGEMVNRIGKVFSGGSSTSAFTIIGGQYSCGYQQIAWWRKPFYMIAAGNNPVVILGGTDFVEMDVPLLIWANPINCTIQCQVGLPAWIDGTISPASIPIPEAIMRHSTMDVMFLAPAQGPWTGHGFNGNMFSVTTGGSQVVRNYGPHAQSSTTKPIPFCARTAGADQGSYGIPVSLGLHGTTQPIGAGIITSFTQTADIATLTLNAPPSAGIAMQYGYVKGSIVFCHQPRNIYVVTNLSGATLTLRHLNNLDRSNNACEPCRTGNNIYFVPTGHYTPSFALETTYTSGSSTMTFTDGSGAPGNAAHLPVGAARVSLNSYDAMSPVTEAGSVITASAAGTITFSGNARRTTVERAALFYVPRP